MTLYVLNSPILTDYGHWKFTGPLDHEAVKRLLDDPFVSAIGHAGTAAYLSSTLGINIPVQRTRVRMIRGDRAVVFRLIERLPERVVLAREDLEILPHEFGLLECLK